MTAAEILGWTRNRLHRPILPLIDTISPLLFTFLDLAYRLRFVCLTFQHLSILDFRQEEKQVQPVHIRSLDTYFFSKPVFGPLQSLSNLLFLLACHTAPCPFFLSFSYYTSCRGYLEANVSLMTQRFGFCLTISFSNWESMEFLSSFSIYLSCFFRICSHILSCLGSGVCLIFFSYLLSPVSWIWIGEIQTLDYQGLMSLLETSFNSIVTDYYSDMEVSD